MSKYICDSCGAVDDTEHIHINLGSNNQKPNLMSVDMMGIDLCSDRHMLCSECNTGMWHGKFEKLPATINEEAISKFSKYNMVTQYDHDALCFMEDGVTLNPVYQLMYDQMHAYLERAKFDVGYEQELSMTIRLTNLAHNHPLYRVWSEHPENFNPHCLHELNLRNSRDIVLSIMDSPRDDERSNSALYHAVKMRHNDPDNSYEDLINHVTKTKKYITDFNPLSEMYVKVCLDSLPPKFMDYDGDTMHRKPKRPTQRRIPGIAHAAMMAAITMFNNKDSIVTPNNFKFPITSGPRSLADQEAIMKKAELKRKIKSLKKIKNLYPQRHDESEYTHKLEALQTEHDKIGS